LLKDLIGITYHRPNVCQIRLTRFRRGLRDQLCEVGLISQKITVSTNPVRRLVGPAKMAATNKRLARSNKSPRQG
jgi:hypothetical protein